MKDNKIVAEFMGGKIVECKDVNYMKWDGDECHELFKHRLVFDSTLEFHKNWKWLMPVVKKCLTIVDVNMEYDHEPMLEALSACDIEPLHEQVVEFIKWYNENK